MDLISIIILILTILFVLILLVKRFLYFHPSKTLQPFIENFQEIYEGNLHGLFLGDEKATKIILYCHGNAGNVSTRQEKMINLNKMGFSVLIFDYSGYGKSKGVPNERLCYHSGDVFMAYLLRNGFSKEDIVLYGESLGASVATYLAIKYGVKTLILESPLPSIKSLLRCYSPLLAVLGLIFNEFDTESMIKAFNGRLLLIHSVHDEVIPFSSINKLKLKAEKVIETVGGHNTIEIDWNQIKEFLS